MSDNNHIKDFCLKTYQEAYREKSQSMADEILSRSHKETVSSNAKNSIETEAQKFAIKQTVILGMKRFPNEIPQLWHYIYEAHVYRKSGIKDVNVINNVIKADQSWKKSSGHAFEEMIKELATLSMGESNISFILQRDLNTLIKAGEISNEPRDISWLKEQIKANIFDLYAIIDIDYKKFCFGCIQCKTSIRDRVTRDREPSIHAMESFFWSIVFVLNADYLKNPKFQYMVNGGSNEFPTNGWHGMYNISADYESDRIYALDLDFELLRKHTEKAAHDWLTQRQWFDHKWRAD